MLEVALLPLSPTVEPAVLALNNAHAAELSWLDGDRLTFLLRQAFHARRIGEVDGFLLAFDQGAAYDSPNYLWFRQRYRRFVYVDRVVVAPAARGLCGPAVRRSNRLRRPDWTRYGHLRGQPRSAESDLGRLPRCAGLYRNEPGCDPSR
jgi:predicted GNAT superfamily acetyltransferase